jgi:MinD superfamily P-loop ATPase
VVVNRADLGDDRVHRYCAAEGLEIVLELPNDRRIAEAYARGELLLDAIPDLEQRLSTAWDWITAAARRKEVAS